MKMTIEEKEDKLYLVKLYDGDKVVDVWVVDEIEEILKEGV
jgi:hypothetical protein